ncbi:hypothetical protein PsorP6_015816 [Peronosclerospora sorghi]|uniref:Uncharacterized protein n=1 Tax=Peronosclerospora sorghi TaxID=230839 RepID=A0ACC0WNP0_9STRA|nr:hypothetical protein PsorP6_015816 [Peronosclerospora sorghi]
MIDFFGEAPDMTKLKAPKSPGTLEATKGNLKKQEENAQDLVLGEILGAQPAKAGENHQP